MHRAARNRRYVPESAKRVPWPSVAILDDTPLCRDGERLKPGHGDFHRFAALFATRVGSLTLCMPVKDSNCDLENVPLPSVLDGTVRLVPTFPYFSVFEYLRKLPRALRRNVPLLRREIRSADLTFIRLPAANGLIAFLFALLYRKPMVVFLVGYPAAGRVRLTERGLGAARVLRAAARLDWWIITLIARHSLTFAYGSDLADRLTSAGAHKVHVTFTSLVGGILPYSGPEYPRLRIRLLFAGRFVSEKGIDVLLDAAALLVAEGYDFHIDLAGDGPLAAELRAHPTARDGLRVQFHGWVEDGPALDSLFERADIFVHPSRSEGIPKVFLKAMAHGIPIVATHVGGIPDIITDGVSGRLVPPNNVRMLADALSCLMSDRELAEKLGRSGHDFALEHTAKRQVDTIWREIVAAYPQFSAE